MIHINAIDHICLWVNSLTKAKAYYEKLFGFQCTAREGDVKTLVVESDKIHFFIRENFGNSEFIPKQHLSLEVNSINEIITNLELLGITEYKVGTVKIFERRNYKWCEWRDPDGIRLECVEIIPSERILLV